ncbi:MAG: hypothetical protein GC168_00070 [Candidatus Hydrogenedens sp.]|nr:hypothetical protein [Candidatus Hydrogenedens sp.]
MEFNGLSRTACGVPVVAHDLLHSPHVLALKSVSDIRLEALWGEFVMAIVRLGIILLLSLSVPLAGYAATEDQKLTASDAGVSDLFGYSASVSGDTAIIGAYEDDDGGSNSGSAYVFVRSGGVWTQQQRLNASDVAANDWFGSSVSVSGDTALVGARGDDDGGTNSGSAYVFVRSGGVWTQQQKLTASDAAANDNFGYNVSVSGDTALVGAIRDDDAGIDSGSAYVYVRSGGVWTQQQKLTASDAAANDNFGYSVSVSGDTALLGAAGDDSARGSAYVYARIGGVWAQQQKLTASDAAASDLFGYSVSVSGDTAVLGAIRVDDGGTDAGSAYVYVRSGGVWTQQQKLTASDAAANDWFGYSVSVSGDTTVLGALRDDDGGSDSGSAYVYVRSGGVWTQQQKLSASDAAGGDGFGSSVSVSGDAALVGANGDDDGGVNSGSAYVFTIDTTPPNATSITPLTGSPTNATTVSLTVTFDEEVQNFDGAGDVVVGHTGTAHTGVSISGGPSVYTVDVTGVSGDGSFTLAVNTGSDVEDLAGNALASSVTSAAVVIDNTVPTVSIGAPAGSPVNSGATASFPITVTGSSSVNLASGNVTITHSGTAGGSVTIVNGTTASPAVEVTGVTGDGSYTIGIAAGIATDAATNTSLVAGPSAAVAVDNTAPGVSIGAPVGSPVNSGGTATYPVTVTGSDSVSLVSGNVTINHSGTAGGSVTVLDGTTTSPAVEVTGVTGDGSYTIGIAAGIAADAATNTSLAAGPSSAVTVDNTAPVFSNVVSTPAEAGANDTVTITFDSTEAIPGDPEVTVNGNPATIGAKAAFTYSYTVPPTDPIGPATIAISGMDSAGNANMLSNSTALTIVPAAPELPVAAWPLGLALAAAGGLALRRRRAR